MSPNSLSNLAVQDITDEAAAMSSGGALFQGFDNANGTGAGPAQEFLDSAGVNSFRSFSLTGSLAPVNNIIEGFKANSILLGRKYRVDFFDNTNFTGLLESFDFTNAQNGVFRALPVADRNKTSSVRITRTV